MIGTLTKALPAQPVPSPCAMVKTSPPALTFNRCRSGSSVTYFSNPPIEIAPSSVPFGPRDPYSCSSSNGSKSTEQDRLRLEKPLDPIVAYARYTPTEDVATMGARTSQPK